MASRTWLDLPVFRATRVKWQRRIFSIIPKNRAIFEDRARQLPLLAYKLPLLPFSQSASRQKFFIRSVRISASRVYVAFPPWQGPHQFQPLWCNLARRGLG